MTENVLVGDTRLDVTCNKVSLQTKFDDEFSSMMTLFIIKRPLKKRFWEPGTKPKLIFFSLHDYVEYPKIKYYANFYKNQTFETFKNADFVFL